MCSVASISVNCLYVSGLDRWLELAQLTYVDVSISAGPIFLLHVATRTLVRRASAEMACCWKSRRLVVRLCFLRIMWMMQVWNRARWVWMVSGMS